MNLRTSLPLKVAAIFLVIISLLAGVLCVIGFVAAYENEFYFSEAGSYYESDMCYSQLYTHANTAYRWYLEGLESSDMQDWYMEDRTNFGFQLINRNFPQQILLTNFVPVSVGAYEEIEFDTYLVRAYVTEPLQVRDDFYRGMLLFNIVYSNRVAFIIVGLIAAVVFLMSIVYLFCAVGHHKGKEGITLNHQDKLPYDLYLVLAAAALTFTLFLPMNSLYFDTAFEIILVIVLGVVSALIILATILTTVTRLKYGKYWRNSITYRVCLLLVRGGRALGRGLKEAFHSIRFTWRAVLVFLAITFINVFLGVWFMGSGDFFPFLLGLVFNIFLLFVVSWVAMDLQKLKVAGIKLAQGDFDYRVNTHKMLRDFREHAENLGSIGGGMAIAVEQRMKSERLKTELITNVSHDIKTPLTSIINYVDLLGKEPLEGKASEYVTVLERQGKRLKKLTEDLVEASKASTGNISTSLMRTGVCELVGQSLAEYMERLEAGKLNPVVSAPQEEIYVMADGRLLWRVFDNLLSNASKYSLAGSRLYIDIEEHGREVAIAFKNISREKLNIHADELMERFVRGDSARSTEGSGLGLNIARSLVEMMHGTLTLTVDGDLFKAEIRFPAVA